MIKKLIQCSLEYNGTPIFTMIAHNGQGYDHFHLFKDLAQFEKTTDYDLQYSKIRSEGVKTRYAEITVIYKGSRVMVLRLVDSFKFITCGLAKFPERFSIPWKKGDIISMPMSDYNTRDAVMLHYGWLMFSVNASLETNGIDPTSSFSTAGFSLKAYRHSFYDGTIMDLSSWDVKRRSSAMEDYWFNEILIRERG